MTIRTEMSTHLQSPLEQLAALGEISFGRMEDGRPPEAKHALVDSTLHGEIFSFCGPQQEEGCIVDVVEPLDARVGHQVVVEELKAADFEAAEITDLCGRSVDNPWTDSAHDLLHSCCDHIEIVGLSSAAECSLDHGDRIGPVAVYAFYDAQNSIEGVHLEQQIFDVVADDLLCVGHDDLRSLHASEKASRAVTEHRFCVDGLATVELGFRAPRGGVDQVRDPSRSLVGEWG